jgi:asparagine synthase (glutamine-hydrolysing)
MADASGRWVVTYNGEIYNYLELREELEAAGVRFRSHSDTEVLLEACARWGPAAVERFNGMFSFALWDRKERTLFAARDRFGEKPFFYRLTPGREFRFASEIKALFLEGDPPPRPRLAILHRFLAHDRYWQRLDETFYEGIALLPPAHTLLLRDGRLEVRRYWGLPEEPAAPGGTEGEQVARVRDLLEDSVRIRMRSDVPLGTCLSGGLDSSTVVAMVSRLLARGADPGSSPRRATFSACFPDNPADETPFIDDVVAATGVETHRTFPSPEGMVEDLPRLMHALDEPFSGPPIYAEWKVFELAKKRGVTVLLNGQGGDEVFAGYHFFFGDLWWSLLRQGRLAALRREMKEYDALHGAGAARRILRPALRERVPRWARRLRGGGGVLWLTEEFRRTTAEGAPPPPSGLRTSLRESQYLRMLPHLLRQGDRIGMAFSREARLPFLDHRLVEFLHSLPDPMKLRGGTTKWALREAIRGLVPESVRNRHDKVGFAVPKAAWLRGALHEVLNDTLLSKRVEERGIFEPKWIRFNLDRLDRGDDMAAGPLWKAFLGETWLRVCIDARGGSA